MVHRQPSAHLLFQIAEGAIHLGGGLRIRVALALFESRRQPLQPLALSWRQLLRLQPFDLDFGVAAGIGGRGDLAEPGPHLLGDAALEPRTEGPQATPQPAHADAAIVQRFGVFGILQARAGSSRLVEKGERKQARRNLGRLIEQYRTNQLRQRGST